MGFIVLLVIVGAAIYAWKHFSSQPTQASTPPRPVGSFDEEFTWLCGFMGGSSAALHNALGEPNDIDRAWIYFDAIHTSFCIDNGRVIRMSVPVIDAFGHSLPGDSARYSLQGVGPGMGKREVQSLWGDSTNGNYDGSGWRYDNRARQSRSGDLAVPILNFGVESELVETFEARLGGVERR